jgi:quercetin dioxygenase-like cupin family protein
MIGTKRRFFMKSVKLEDAPRFERVKGAEMAFIGDGERMTLIRILADPGAIFEDHAHHHEQVGTCIEGGGTLTSGGKTIEVKPGVTWVIPPNEVHNFVAMYGKHSIIYEVWSPPREDYRKWAKIV